MISPYPKMTVHAHIPVLATVIHYRYVILFSLLSLSIAYSCKMDTKLPEESLYGKWDIVKAERNGKVTPYLRGGYFVFDKSGSMVINITGSDETGPFTLKNKSIRLSQTKEFLIESMSADSLALRYIMNPTNNYTFYLSKNTSATK